MAKSKSGAEPWAELGIPVGSSLDVARRAWRAAALDTHPDRGGDAATFGRKRAAWLAIRSLISKHSHLVVVPDPPRPWSQSRALRRARELGLDVEDFGDVIGVVGEDGTPVWFTDDDVEAEGCVLAWEEIDDYLAWHVFDLAGATQRAYQQ